MPQQPAITLSSEERRHLEIFVHRGKANARTLTRARILLKSAEGWSTATLATTFDVCEATVSNVRRRFAQGGLEAVLHDKVQQHRRSALSGRFCCKKGGAMVSSASIQEAAEEFPS